MRKLNTCCTLLFLLTGLFIGCQSEQPLAPAGASRKATNARNLVADPQAYRFPPNVAFQLKSHVKCRTPMLLIPLSRVDDYANVILDHPVEIAYPFDDMPSLTGYQYVVQGYLWTIGDKGFLFAFLLLGSDGSIYYLDTPDTPFGIERDIRFFQADVSADWQESFANCLKDEPWSGSSGIWQLPHGGTGYQWRNPGVDLPIVKDFCANHPLASNSAEGKWEFIKPQSTPNLYCAQGKHEMPRFSAKQVLMLRPIVQDVYVGAGFTEKMKHVLFPNGTVATHITGLWQEIDKFWQTGKYKILAYDMSSEKDVADPERHDWAISLRTHAADKGIPLVILYGDDPDAPQYDGLPKGIGQYWQCPQCSLEQMGKP